MSNVKAGIDKTKALEKIYNPDCYWVFRCIRDVLTAMDTPEDMASKTINGTSLCWMLDQIRKQEKRLMAVEKAYELERLEDIERRIGELDSKVARIIYETNCYEAIYGKPSVPEKPRHTDKDLDLLVEKIRGSNRPTPDTISIPRDVACRFVELIDDIGGTWKNGGGMRETYDAIKQALKNKGE